MRSLPNYFLLTGHHDPPAGRKLCMQRLIHAQGLSTLADKIGMVFGTSKLKNCMVTIFVLKKCICIYHALAICMTQMPRGMGGQI